VDARRPTCLELGLFLIVVVLPLAITPFTKGPFADAKTLALPIGALLLWLGGVGIDRGLAWAAAAWAGVTIAATATGVDPAAGLVATASGAGGGTALTICCAVLLVSGAGLPRDLVARARGWLVWTGVAVSAVLLAYRLAPSVADAIPKVNLIGATLGNQLFAAAFVAAAMAAVAAGDEPRRRRLVLLAFMTVAVTSTGERSSLILPLVALAVAWWRARSGWRATLSGTLVVLAAFAAWQAAGPLLPEGTDAGGSLQQFGSTASDTPRFTVWRAGARAVADRPVLGWGPGATQAAYLHETSPDEVPAQQRGWRDAHNLLIEVGVTTGILGVASVLALLGIAAVRALRSPPSDAWVVGAAAALAAYSVVEPLNLVLTPLLFLMLGVASHTVDPSGAPEREPAVRTRLLRAAVAGTLGVTVAVAALSFAASTFERQGYDYGDETALRTALRLQPWRLSARQELAIQLATRARAGVDGAAEDAAGTIAAGVRARPWDPNVRLTAAQVATLVNDPEAARAWLQDQLERFPGDGAWVSQNANAPTVTGS